MKFTVKVYEQPYVYENIEAETKEEAIAKVTAKNWADFDDIMKTEAVIAEKVYYHIFPWDNDGVDEYAGTIEGAKEFILSMFDEGLRNLRIWGMIEYNEEESEETDCILRYEGDSREELIKELAEI